MTPEDEQAYLRYAGIPGGEVERPLPENGERQREQFERWLEDCRRIRLGQQRMAATWYDTGQQLGETPWREGHLMTDQGKDACLRYARARPK